MSTRTDFSLKGLRIFPLGATVITLKSTGEKFQITRAETSVHNYIIGKMYVWNSGEMTCENLNTGDKAILILKPKGWTSKSDYEADGKIIDSSGKTHYLLYGKWNSFVSAIVPETQDEIKLIQRKESPKNWEAQYCFSQWAINENHLNYSMLTELPPTDSRFRTDQRAYEFGAMKLASDEKHRLEESQRSRRKLREQNKVNWKPIWFDFEIEQKHVKKCKFNGKYFDQKKEGDWPNTMMDLFN